MADVAGYSHLIGVDDKGTLVRLNAHFAELIVPKVKEHRGRIVRTAGDGLLVLFISAVDALRCAVEIQCAMTKRNARIPASERIEFRMGVNVGDSARMGEVRPECPQFARAESDSCPVRICQSSG